jgi:hypothetical protein
MRQVALPSVVLLALAACTPTIPDNVFPCASTAECPPDFTCQAGVCRAPGVVGTDAGTPVDGGPGDAGTTPDAGEVLTDIDIEVSATTLTVGQTATATVRGVLSTGGSIVVTEGVTFRSTQQGVATIDATGAIEALAPGMTTIEATVGTLETDTDIVVEIPPPTLPLTVDTYFSGRGEFGPDGPALHTEDDACPMRAGGENGACHRFTWAGGPDGTFTGTFWFSGGGFADAAPVPIEQGATALTFWAWAEEEGEIIEFGAGVRPNDGGPNEDITELRRQFALTTVPTRYRIPLRDLAAYDGVVGGFLFVANGRSNPNGFEFYVDDIQWVEDEPPAASLPLVVDDFFTGRATFKRSPSSPAHVEDRFCPTRAPGFVGDCHRITFAGEVGDFSGAHFVDGTSFADLRPVTVPPGATQLEFWAWGLEGGERLLVGAGIPAGTADGVADERRVTLTTTPTRYVVPLARMGSRSAVYGGLTFVVVDRDTEVFLDSVQWVRSPMGVPAIALPMVVDDWFLQRAGFGDGGPPGHTETLTCPRRAGGARGDCHTITWDEAGTFTGAFWTIGDFGDLFARRVVAGATEIRFYAWGRTGGERVEFGAGTNESDVGEDRLGFILLTAAPVQYRLPLTSLAGYESVAGAFMFAAVDGEMEFYIDDIQWVAP